jgi:hypothetical protein
MLVIERTNAIITEYQAQGFDLTLRQVYYQHVARGFIPNTEANYKRLGSIINDARLAGLINWNAIQDRTRNLRSNPHWASPGDIIASAAYSYRRDLWANQSYRPEVWIEKDALVGVIAGVCNELDVPYFSCRGYTSQSEMWIAAQRLLYVPVGQSPVIYHLGDHDPSGIDMTRDITERLQMFLGHHHDARMELHRLALNMDQVQHFQPPPNPAKTTDSRFASYIRLYGDESWELDALDPPVIVNLIRTAIDAIRDEDAWQEAVDRVEDEKAHLMAAALRWNEVEGFIGGTDGKEEER